MILSQPLLARTKAPKDNLVNDTLGRLLVVFIRWQFDQLFDEASALQQRQNKTSRTRPFNKFTEFDNHMSKGKISNAIKCLREGPKGGLLVFYNESTLSKANPPWTYLNEKVRIQNKLWSDIWRDMVMKK